jgi:hypothetical protein
MSRYTASFDQFTIAWGYDRPLQEYFFHMEDATLDNDDDGLVYAISNRFPLKADPNNPKPNYSNSDILEKMLEFKAYIPPEHISALRNDLPF